MVFPAGELVTARSRAPLTQISELETAFPPTEIFVGYNSSTVVLHLQIHDAAATSVTVPPITNIATGSSLADVFLAPPNDPGWDATMLDIGESMGTPPAWRG